MKKLIFSLFLVATSLTFASSSNSVINYPPLTVPKGQEMVFDLAKGIGSGMRGGLNYDMDCNLIANDKVGISLERGSPLMFWGKLTIDGKAFYNPAEHIQLEVNPNSTIEFSGLSFPAGGPNPVVGPHPSSLYFINLGDIDYQLTCTARIHYS
jgi:hypothetical protein